MKESYDFICGLFMPIVLIGAFVFFIYLLIFAPNNSCNEDDDIFRGDIF